jgi:hypothetical protein
MKRLTCSCGKVLGYEPRHAGKEAKCDSCGAAIALPAADGAAEMIAPEDVVLLGPKPETPPVPTLHHGPLRQFANFVVKKWALPLFIFLVGGAVALTGIVNGALANNWMPEPDRITLAELPERGPEANSHVIVGEASAVPSEAITLVRKVTDKRSGNVTTTSEAYVVPLRPTGGPPPGKDCFFLMIVFTSDEARFNEALDRPEYQGTVFQGVDYVVGSEKANLIRQHFPQTANSRVYVLQEGLGPWDRWLTLALFVAGCLIAVGALALGVMRTL